MWRERLTSLIDELGLNWYIVFTGHVSQRELECAYLLSDFTILPSIAEGFGLVVVESRLNGKPVIVSRAAGMAELIEGVRIRDLPITPTKILEALRRS